MNRRSRLREEACGDGPLSDRRLLKQYVDQKDDDAFGQLVSRYRGLVLGVCRRTLHDEHAAEDAFQATFLVLARRASRIYVRSSLAGWLYAVAYRTALAASSKRFTRREEPLQDDMTATDDVLARITSRHEQQLLDEELNQLSAKYREPLVLRYLMGKSNKQVAAELGLAVGVVEGRLKRGKKQLRLRLARRGLGLTMALAAVGLSAEPLRAAATDSLVAATTRAAVAFGRGGPPVGNGSENVIRLAKKELAMKSSTITAATSGVAAAIVVAGVALACVDGGGLESAGQQSPDLSVTETAPESIADSAEGDSLPVRLATMDRPKSAPRPESPSAAAAEPRILKTLTELTEFEFFDAPLSEVIEYVAEAHAINVQLDHGALDDLGLDADEPVTIALADVSLQSALNHLLRPLELGWTIRDEALLITSRDEVELNLVTKVYDVSDLVLFQDKSGERWSDYDTLIGVLTSVIEPDSWDDGGGPGSIEAAPFAGAEMLAVAQTYQIHQKIEQLFEQLRATALADGAGELPTREKPAAGDLSDGLGGPQYGGLGGGGSSGGGSSGGFF